jgi:DNA-binding Lrp family transcriptional regulator
MNNSTLDVKDKKILLALDMHARTPDSQISKIVGLSKQLTNFRIKRLEKNGFIKSYYPVIDHTKLGLKLYRILLKLGDLEKGKEAELIGYLKPKASWVASVLGKWDLSVALYVEDEYAFITFWKRFHEIYGGYIAGRSISLMTSFWNFERSFIYPKNKKRDVFFLLGGKSSTLKTDRVDREILYQLTLNSRQTSLQLARSIKQTERVVRYRIKRLEKEKVILGYRTFIDTKLLGMKFYKLFIELKNTRQHDIKKIRSYLMISPNVAYSTEALSGYDFEIEVFLSDSHELFHFIQTLKNQFPNFIHNVVHHEYMLEHKITYYPLES